MKKHSSSAAVSIELHNSSKKQNSKATNKNSKKGSDQLSKQE